MKRCVGCCVGAVLVGFLLVPKVGAAPSCFWYKTFGLSNYAARSSGPNLDVALMHDSVGAAVSRHEEAMGGWVWNCGYSDDIYNYDLHGADAPLNDYDFAVVHTHGNPPDCSPSNNFAPWYLGYCEDCPVRQSDLELGGNGYLKWLWAASCQMFHLPAWHDRISIWGTTSVMGCEDGTAELPTWRKLDAYGAYAASGVIVQDSTTLTECGSDDSYTRYCCLNYSHHSGLNKLLLKVSAPGLPWVRRGTVQVWLREGYEETPEYLVGSFEVYGSGGSVVDKLSALSTHLEDYNLTSEGADRSLHLEFVDCTADLTVHGIYFYYDPLLESGVQDQMAERVECMGQVFQGCHSILGYSHNFLADMLHKQGLNNASRFLDRWVVDEYDIMRSFFSLGTYGGATGWTTTAPAVAAAVGPQGNTYRYLYETWESATDDPAATTGQCMISWCIPYFHNPSDGYWWVEEIDW